MITPRVTRLLRAADVRALQQTLVDLLPRGWEARSAAVIVPSRSAAGELRRTIEDMVLGADRDAALVLPDFVTRSELYSRLHGRLADVPALLNEFEREVLLRLAAEDARAAGADAPFKLRPGLLAAMLGFYDELRRRNRTIDSLDRLVGDKLEAGLDTDRGAERLLRQTRFLAAAFAAFERRVADSGRIDEHALRSLLLSAAPLPPYGHIVVAVADQAADPRGLWPADFDLLSRMAGVERLDVVATENVLASGWHQRLHDTLPGLVEERPASPSVPPVLVAPVAEVTAEAAHFFVHRDREEELVDAARWVKRRAREAAATDPLALERSAVIFQRPLPYLYLGRQVFSSARIPYQASDALPLAAESYAAALDLVFLVASEDATRSSLVELLASPHWAFVHDGLTIGRAHVAALDRVLRESKFLGGWEQLSRLAGAASTRDGGSARDSARWRVAVPALAAAIALAPRIERLRGASTASQQIDALLDFVESHERVPTPAAPGYERHVRARAAILGALTALRDAHRRYDDRPLPIAELVATMRRWIEGQTFEPRTGASGLRLIDATSAVFARIDAARLVGLVESDWPERSSANIFYPAGLLRELGWPPESERLAAARARFHDLLMLAGREVSISAFTLEEDAIVAASPFVEEIAVAGLTVERAAPSPFVRIFDHEALSLAPVLPADLSAAASEWLTLRLERTAGTDARFHGQVGARPGVVYAVSHVERYLECPFKYFAGRVLQLEEEREDESGLTPLERGQLLHGVFEAFFVQWRERGHGGITTTNLDEALALFEEVAEAQLLGLPEGDRALERTYLLGSAASPGLAERAFAFEIEQGVGVAERLLEYPFEGTFEFKGSDAVRTVSVRGKADRIDVLDDGTLRIVDYKLGRAPKTARALQLPIYGICAEQQLEAERGGRRPISRAGYVAFKEKNAFVDLSGKSGLEAALRDGQQRFLDAIAAIERGEYPPDPDELWTCNRCGFPHVCRKDYVGDE